MDGTKECTFDALKRGEDGIFWEWIPENYPHGGLHHAMKKLPHVTRRYGNFRPPLFSARKCSFSYLSIFWLFRFVHKTIGFVITNLNAASVFADVALACVFIFATFICMNGALPIVLRTIFYVSSYIHMSKVSHDGKQKPLYRGVGAVYAPSREVSRQNKIGNSGRNEVIPGTDTCQGSWSK